MFLNVGSREIAVEKIREVQGSKQTADVVLDSGDVIFVNRQIWERQVSRLSSHLIPAQPGTYFISFMDAERAEDHTKWPIIAWSVSPTGDVYPVSASEIETGELLILHPCGMVEHRHAAVYPSVDAAFAAEGTRF